MLVSINSTEITTDEIRISATNLETILLADDHPIWVTRNISISSANRSVLRKIRKASEK